MLYFFFIYSIWIFPIEIENPHQISSLQEDASITRACIVVNKVLNIFNGSEIN